jgi:hypothetical protein
MSIRFQGVESVYRGPICPEGKDALIKLSDSSATLGVVEVQALRQFDRINHSRNTAIDTFTNANPEALGPFMIPDRLNFEHWVAVTGEDAEAWKNASDSCGNIVRDLRVHFADNKQLTPEIEALSLSLNNVKGLIRKLFEKHARNVIQSSQKD